VLLGDIQFQEINLNVLKLIENPNKLRYYIFLSSIYHLLSLKEMAKIYLPTKYNLS